MTIDSKQVLNAISQSARTKERHVMIDKAAAKQGFQNREITDLGSVIIENMFEDTFTMIIKPHQLNTALSSGIINHPIVSWIIRDDKLLSYSLREHKKVRVLRFAAYSTRVIFYIKGKQKSTSNDLN